VWEVLIGGLYNQGVYTPPLCPLAGKTVVPEPATLLMLAGGVLGLLMWRWRKRRSS